MRFVRLAGLAAGVVLAALAAGAPAANVRGRVAFGSREPLALAAGTPAQIQVCAVGDGDVPVTFAVEGVPAADVTFGSASGGPAPASIPAGACLPLVVTVSTGAANAAGTLVAVSPGAVARRPFAVSPSATSGTAPLTPLRLVLHARRHLLFGEGTHLLNPALPFGPYEPGTRLDVGAFTAPGGTLAVLLSGGEQAFLVIDGPPPPADDRGVVALPVRLDGAAKPGAYRGTITFTDAAGQPQDVTVTVDVGDSVWWCVAAILLGVAVTLLALLLARRVWPTLRLLGFRKRLSRRYRRAVKAYNAEAAREEGLPRLVFDEGSAETYERHLGEAYRRYLRDHTFVDADSSAYRALRALVHEAREDSEFVRDEDGLIAVLRDLRTAIAQLERWRRPGGGTLDPRLLARARRILESRAIGVGSATSLGAQAGTYTALLDAWPRLFEQLLALEEWATELQERAGTFPAWHQAKFSRARGDLARARDALLAAETPEAFDDRHLLRYLDRANTTLYELSAVFYSVAYPEPAERKQTLAAVAEEVLRAREQGRLNVPLAVRARWLAVPGRATVDRARRLEEAEAAPPPALAYGTVGLGGSMLALLIAMGGALATGLAVLYSATFGSTADYLIAFGLGAAAAAAAKAVVAGIANLRRAPA